jgi:hypothetical protein
MGRVHVRDCMGTDARISNDQSLVFTHRPPQCLGNRHFVGFRVSDRAGEPFFLGLATRFPQLSPTGCEANKTACDPFTVLWLRAQERKYEALAVGADVIPATLLTDCAG